MKLALFLIPILLVFSCETYHVRSMAATPEYVYMTVLKDSGNPYDPNRITNKLIKCKPDSEQNLNCQAAGVKGLKTYEAK
jgi:hypothetical protein